MPAPRKTCLNRAKAPYQTLAHLANTGPADEAALRAFVHVITGAEDNPRPAYHVLRQLEARGFIRTKVWLTPEGLEELRRHDWKPERIEEERPA